MSERTPFSSSYLIAEGYMSAVYDPSSFKNTVEYSSFETTSPEKSYSSFASYETVLSAETSSLTS